MTKSTKTAPFSWTDKNVAALKAAYTGDNSKLAKIAAELGAKSAASVRSKLVSLGEYSKSESAAAPTKGGKILKSAVVDSITDRLRITPDALISLTAATMAALTALAEAIQPENLGYIAETDTLVIEAVEAEAEAAEAAKEAA